MLKKDNVKSVHITFRMTEEEYAPFKETMEKLGYKRSEFFRMITLNNLDSSVKEEYLDKSIKRLLFYFNKASNNINQLAKQVNTQAKINGIDERKLIQFYSKLNRIYDSFENGLNQAKRSAKNQE